MNKALISIVIPAFNEEPNVQRCYDELKRYTATLENKYDFEFVFTDNHSTDQTFNVLQKICAHDPRVRAYRFSRNFGYQKSILMGYLKSRGNAAIQFDCDLQDPPQMIPKFLDHWERGHQVVYGVRKKRQEGFVITALRKTFYRLINALSETDLPADAGDFRLIDRKIISELGKLRDADPYLRGAISELGFSQIGVEYERDSRKFGESKFNFRSLFRLALDGITNHSVLPLRIATYVGILTSALTFLGFVGYLAGRFIFKASWPAGFATTTTLILISLSLNSLFLGIIGEYLARIYIQLKKSPLAIIEKSLNEREQG